ncbi:MAG: DUF4384 domain-containing protein [Deltaproteobacteria bacterium]|nr:DUF4384 domain-containing protein [Deltaproteobacteria bacterium]
MISPCPSDLALERHLADPTHSAVREHVEACDHCEARLAEMERLGTEFQRFVFPATVDKVVAVTERRPFFALPWIGVLAPMAAAAAVVLVLLPEKPPADYVGLKGSGLSLTPFVATPSGPKALADHDRVPRGAGLRFKVHADQACYLTLLSLDDAGQVSELYPTSPEPALIAAGETTLQGGIRLDDQAGSEQFFAVCTEAPVPMSELRALLTSTLGSAARPLAAIDGLPDGTRQTSLTLEKAP